MEVERNRRNDHRSDGIGHALRPVKIASRPGAGYRLSAALCRRLSFRQPVGPRRVHRQPLVSARRLDRVRDAGFRLGGGRPRRGGQRRGRAVRSGVAGSALVRERAAFQNGAPRGVLCRRHPAVAALDRPARLPGPARSGRLVSGRRRIGRGAGVGRRPASAALVGADRRRPFLVVGRDAGGGRFHRHRHARADPVGGAVALAAALSARRRPGPGAPAAGRRPRNRTPESAGSC